MSREQTEEGRVEVLPVQWRKHLNLEVGTCLLHALAAASRLLWVPLRQSLQSARGPRQTNLPLESLSLGAIG